MTQCPNLGRIYQRTDDGSHPDVYQCKSPIRFCTLAPSGLLTVFHEPLAHCSAECEFRPPTDEPNPIQTVCDYRGDPKGTDTADLCGYKGVIFEVFECLNDKLIKEDGTRPLCAENRYCRKQTSISCGSCRHHSVLQK